MIYEVTISLNNAMQSEKLNDLPMYVEKYEYSQIAQKRFEEISRSDATKHYGNHGVDIGDNPDEGIEFCVSVDTYTMVGHHHLDNIDMKTV